MDFNAPSGSSDPNAGYVGKTASTIGSKVPPKAVEYPQREIVNAEKSAGLVPSNGDTTQLAQSIGRGLWIGTLGANANALVGSIGAGANANAPAILQTLNSWTRLRGIALQTNTSVDVTVTVSGIGTAGGVMTAPLRKRDGTTKPAVGDVPTLWPFEVQWDGTYFRFVGAVASDGGGTGSGSSGAGRLGAIVAYTTAGIYSWPCPAGVTLIRVTAIAAGGGGAPTVNGGGGGAGERREGYFAVPGGQTYTLMVGAGGVAVSSGTAGNGGATSFGGIGLTSAGGFGASTTGAANASVGGSGGTGGQLAMMGGSGDGLTYYPYAKGGQAAGMASGRYAAFSPNPGAGGSATNGSATPANVAFNGADGAIFIE